MHSRRPSGSNASRRAPVQLPGRAPGYNGIEARFLQWIRLTRYSRSIQIPCIDGFHARAPIGERRGVPALQRAGRGPGDRRVIVSHLQGFLSQAGRVYVAELGLRRDVLGFDLGGQGFGGALRTGGCECLAGKQAMRACVVICVEVCPAAMYLDDDPGVLISACLFGDAPVPPSVQSPP